MNFFSQKKLIFLGYFAPHNNYMAIFVVFCVWFFGTRLSSDWTLLAYFHAEKCPVHAALPADASTKQAPGPRACVSLLYISGSWNIGGLDCPWIHHLTSPVPSLRPAPRFHWSHRQEPKYGTFMVQKTRVKFFCVASNRKDLWSSTVRGPLVTERIHF